jgi:2-C-methyl-D-erythritol 4-phosphate cytidylyltransferase
VTAQQPLRGDVAVLVPAAGLGTRLGPGAPKALRELRGVPLLVHAVRRLSVAPSVGRIVVAAPVGAVEDVRALLATQAQAEPHELVPIDVVEGGQTRQDSVRSALLAVPPEYDVILVHDAARAFAPPDMIERVAAAVRDGHDAVIPVLPVVDTVKHVDESGHVVGTVDRTVLRAVQTPQGFRRHTLEEAHKASADGTATDDAGLVERIGVRVYCVPGAVEALKITRPADMAFADALLPADGGRTLGS